MPASQRTGRFRTEVTRLINGKCRIIFSIIYESQLCDSAPPHWEGKRPMPVRSPGTVTWDLWLPNGKGDGRG